MHASLGVPARGFFMASKKWKTSSLPFFKSRVKDMPDPLSAQSSGRALGTEYKMRLMQRKQSGFSGEVPKHRYSDELEAQKALQAPDKKGYGHTRSDSAGSVSNGGQTGDLLFLEIRCKQLKDERDIFEQLFLAEQLKNRRMVRRFTNHEVGGVHLDEAHDQASVQKLEAQLQGFSDRCEALDCALKAKDLEAKDLTKHVHDLEASASASGTLVEQQMKKINHLRDELAKSETDRLLVQRSLDEKNLELLLTTQKVMQLEDVIGRNRTDYQEQVMLLREELAKAEFECFDSNRSLEDKTAEAKKLTELVNFLENQVSKAQQKMISIQGEILHLKSDLARSEGTWVESFCQLEQVHSRKIADLMCEKASLQDQLKDFEDKLQGEELFNELLDTDNGFEFQPCDDSRVKLNRALSLDSRKDQSLLNSPQRSPAWWSSPFRSPTRSHGLIQSLLDMGEASLDSADEEEVQSWQAKLAQVEMREKVSTEELRQKTRQLAELQNVVARMKTELVEEKEKAKEEAEDLAQEMAELRFQLMEMLDHERELRSRTEQASVHRVEELEAQLRRSRQETVAALARRRESEARLDEKSAEVASLQLKLKKETLTVNQLRIENQELKQQYKTMVLELSDLIEQQNMQAHERAMGSESKQCENEASDHTMVSRMGQLSLLEELHADAELDEGLTGTPKSEFENAGVRLFEEWVQSGCQSKGTEEGMDLGLLDCDVGQDVADESAVEGQSQDAIVSKPEQTGGSINPSRIGSARLGEAGWQDDLGTVTSADLSPECIISGQESSEAVHFVQADSGSSVLQCPSALECEHELESSDLVTVSTVEVEMTSYEAVQEQASEVVAKLESIYEAVLESCIPESLSLVKEHGEMNGDSPEDSLAEFSTVEAPADVQPHDEEVEKERACEDVAALEVSNPDSLPLVEAETSIANDSQDILMVNLEKATSVNSVDDLADQLCTASTENSASESSGLDAKVDDSVENDPKNAALALRCASQESLETELETPSASLEGDPGFLCPTAPDVQCAPPEEYACTETLIMDVQGEPLAIMREGAQDEGDASTPPESQEHDGPVGAQELETV